jgi:nitrogen fixation protein FixH
MIADPGQQPERAARRGSWIPWIFVAGFGVVLAVNVIMVYVAATTWPGIAVNRSYDKGLTYNRNLEAAARQEALAWTASIETTLTGSLAGMAQVTLTDAAGAPLYRATVSLAFERPTHEGYDFAVQLEPEGDGLYSAPFTVPLPGLWDLRLIVSHGDDRLVTTERVLLQ